MTLVAFPFDQLWCVAANCLHQMYFHLISNTLPDSSELPVLDILGHLLFVSHECHMSITHPMGMNLGGKTVAAEECSAVKWTHWPVLKQSQTVKTMSFHLCFYLLIISVGACVFFTVCELVRLQRQDNSLKARSDVILLWLKYLH